MSNNSVAEFVVNKDISIMKKFITVITTLCFCLPVMAKDLGLLHPNTPGSISDSTARIIAAGYKNLTGDNLIVEGVAGGFHVPAVVNWKQRTQPTIFMTTSTALVFNPKLIKDLPYNDTDFDHVTLISEVVSAWVVRPDSPYYNMADVTSKLATSKKPFVAYANHSEAVNYHLVAKKYNWGSNVTPIKYKGVPEVISGLFEGSVEVAVISINPTLIGQIQDNRLRIIGHTSTGDAKIGNTTVKSVTEQTGVSQFNGFTGLALPATMNKQQAEKIKQNLIKTLNDTDVRMALARQNSAVVNKGPEHKKKYINEFRNAIEPIEFNN